LWAGRDVAKGKGVRRRGYALLVVTLLAVIWGACDEETNGTGTGGSSAGGGGCAPGQPAPLFTVTIQADPGPLPADTTVVVNWSAGEEPIYVLGDTTTHKTLEDGSNLTCETALGQGGGTPGEVLRCELWTSGTTEVDITASGYVAVSQTLLPAKRDDCDEPMPSEVEIVIDEDQGGGGR
jgi:L-ascorbate metabolism protein UlaG (beta-lactamase superfamily)